MNQNIKCLHCIPLFATSNCVFLHLSSFSHCISMIELATIFGWCHQNKILFPWDGMHYLFIYRFVEMPVLWYEKIVLVKMLLTFTDISTPV